MMRGATPTRFTEPRNDAVLILGVKGACLSSLPAAQKRYATGGGTEKLAQPPH